MVINKCSGTEKMPIQASGIGYLLVTRTTDITKIKQNKLQGLRKHVSTLYQYHTKSPKSEATLEVSSL